MRTLLRRYACRRFASRPSSGALLAASLCLVVLGAALRPGAARAQIPVRDNEMLTVQNPAYVAAITAYYHGISRPRWQAYLPYVLALTGGYDWRDLGRATGRLGQPMARPEALGWARANLREALAHAFPGLKNIPDGAERARDRLTGLLRTYRATLEGVGRKMEGFREALGRIEQLRQRAQLEKAVGAASHQLQAQLRIFLGEQWLLLRQQLMTQMLMSNLELGRGANRRAEAHAALTRALGLDPTP